MGSWDCGVFTHREIAQRLMDTFTGLKLKELAWFENPREKTLKMCIRDRCGTVFDRP